MKKLLLMATMLLTLVAVNAQNKVYKGNSTSYSDCLLTIDGKKVYQGNSTSYSDCLATIDGILKYSIVAILIGPY
jgi:hypothetical protein